jgi:hypothetical protein
MIRSLLLFIFASSFAVANDSDENISLDALSRQILEEEPDAVDHCTVDKMYLKSEKIFPTDGGLFLGDASFSLPLPLVLADSSGCYLPYAGSNKENTGYWYCLECGSLWHSLTTPSRCPNGHHRNKIVPGNI